MGFKENTISIGENKYKNRLGCSICLRKSTCDNLIINPSISKLHLANNYLESNEKKNKKKKHNECYCKHMEQIKEKSIPKLLCSKRYSNINRNGKEEDWFNDVITFRRENWFDCHSNNVIDSTCINPLCKYIVLTILFKCFILLLFYTILT